MGDDMKEHIIPTLVNYEKNQELLGTLPHKRIMDMAIVYRFIKSAESTGLVTTAALEYMGMTEEQLEAMALENLKTNWTPEIRLLEEPLRVITNPRGLFGSSGLLDRELLCRAAGEVQDDIYIIPVSIHIIMYIPAENADPAELKALLNEGNRKCAQESEYLSENIYIYHRHTGELTVAET